MPFAAGYGYDFNLPTAAPAPAVAAAVLRFMCSQLLIEFFFSCFRSHALLVFLKF